MRLVSAIPALPVQDIQESLAFYVNRLGFTAGYHDDGFAKLHRDAVELHLWAASDRRWESTLAAILAGKMTLPPNIPVCPIVSGAESFLAGTASCRIQVEGIDELYEEYRAKGVLHSVDTHVEPTDWGTREFPAVDLHRNLLTFFQRS